MTMSQKCWLTSDPGSNEYMLIWLRLSDWWNPCSHQYPLPRASSHLFANKSFKLHYPTNQQMLSVDHHLSSNWGISSRSQEQNALTMFSLCTLYPSLLLVLISTLACVDQYGETDKCSLKLKWRRFQDQCRTKRSILKYLCAEGLQYLDFKLHTGWEYIIQVGVIIFLTRTIVYFYQ